MTTFKLCIALLLPPRSLNSFGPKVAIREQALSMIPFDVMQSDMCQHGQHHVEPVCLCSLHYAHSSFTIPVAMLFATSLSQSSHYILVHCWLQE